MAPLKEVVAPARARPANNNEGSNATNNAATPSSQQSIPQQHPTMPAVRAGGGGKFKTQTHQLVYDPAC